MTNQDKIYLRVISLLKCWLIVFVVLIHTYLDAGDTNLFYADAFRWIHDVLFLSNSMFFLFSGFLFFYGLERFSLSWYGNKLRRRVSSLLIPYLLWNTILLLLLSVGVIFAPSLRGDYFIPLQEMTPSGLFRTYFCLYSNIPGCPPLDGPFWFLRDLMWICILSPLLYVISRFRAWSLPLVVVAYLLPFPSISIIYFYIGAYLSIFHIKLSAFYKGHLLHALSLFIFLEVILQLVNMPDFLCCLLTILMSLSGMIVLAHWAYRAVCRWPEAPSEDIQGSLFIVFAFHVVIARVLTKVTLELLQSHEMSSWAYFFMHGLNAIICLLVCYAIYLLINHFSPKLCRILGARTKKP